MLPLPTPSAADWDGIADRLLRRAAALGRRDGLHGQRRDVSATGLAEILPLHSTAIPPRLLLAALRQCYTAGHVHGTDVRNEGCRRRARRVAAPAIAAMEAVMPEVAVQPSAA